MKTRILLTVVGLVLFAISFSSPMLFILPLAIAVYLGKEFLARLTENLSPGKAFIMLGIVFGLLIEVFAILSNLDKPASERILMSPDPLTDLFFGLFYYGMVIVTWYLLVKKYAFSKKEMFFLTGIVLGVGTEQGGAIFLGAISSVVGFGVACLIVIVYGVFPTLAYMVTEGRFSTSRLPSGVRAYFIATVFLLVQWALFGLFVLPFLKGLV